MASRIAVLGTGANGSCIGAALIEAGHDVTLIDQWPEHIEAIRRDGLRIRMAADEVRVRAPAHHLCDVCTFRDIVLLVMKAYDAVWACHLIAPYLAPDGVVVGCQNGMTAEAIAAVVGPERAIGCVIEVSSELATPGIVTRNSPPEDSWFGLGAIDGAETGRVAEVAELLGLVGGVGLSPDILSAKWMKLTVNVMNLAPSAMLGLPMDEAAAVPGMRDLMLQAGAEAVTAGQHLGYKVVPILGLTAAQAENTNQLPAVLLDKINSLVRPGARDTILMDHLKGRRTEAESINGLVVEALARRGIAAPANAAIAAISEQITRGERAPEIANLDRVQSMIEAG